MKDLAELIYEPVISDKVDSLEILPPYLLPAPHKYIIVETHLGVNHKALISYYLELCKSGCQLYTPSTTFLTVLATPENITAFNKRKEMILTNEITFQHELQVTEVLLKSHLYKHCKSPVIWHHRKWVITNSKLTPNWDVEWEVVSMAAVHHPKNYYAWGYFRWFTNYIELKSHKDYHLFLRNLIDLCKQNISDISIWSYARWLNEPVINELITETNKSYPNHEAILANMK